MKWFPNPFNRKCAIIVVVSMAFMANTVHASILGSIKSAASEGGLWAALGAVVLLFIFKRIPNDKIQAIVGKFAYGLGVSMTLGLSRWKITAPFWQSTIEPWFVDLFDNIIGTFTVKFIEGIRSDNTK